MSIHKKRYTVNQIYSGGLFSKWWWTMEIPSNALCLRFLHRLITKPLKTSPSTSESEISVVQQLLDFQKRMEYSHWFYANLRNDSYFFSDEAWFLCEQQIVTEITTRAFFWRNIFLMCGIRQSWTTYCQKYSSHVNSTSTARNPLSAPIHLPHLARKRSEWKKEKTPVKIPPLRRYQSSIYLSTQI